MKHNLSDNEIIKAFECCYLYDVMFCDKCPNKDTCGEIDVGESILDLINRLKAENEKYKTTFEAMVNVMVEAKSEARKEFAERLKEKLGDCNIIHDSFYAGYDTNDTWECIDNLLKEMGCE